MITRWVTVVLCFLMVVGVSPARGCAAGRKRDTTHKKIRGMDQMVVDVDWALGIEEPSMLYEDSFPPHP